MKFKKMFNMVTNGGDSGLEFFKIFLFYHGTTALIKNLVS